MFTSLLEMSEHSVYRTIKHYRNTSDVDQLIGLEVVTLVLFEQKKYLKLFVCESIVILYVNKKILLGK